MTRAGATAAPRDKGESLAGTELELDVGAVAHGGICVARAEGRVVFVRHALPGERVRARVTEGRERDPYLRADAIEVLVASPDRVEQPCPYAKPGRCGGCDWQHATLAAQRRLKADVVAEQLRRLAGIERTVVVEAVPGDQEGLGWRTRVQFGVDAEGRLGLHKHRSADLVPITRCRIAHPDLDELAATAVRWPGAAAVELATAPRRHEALVVITPRPGGRVRIPELARPASLLLAPPGDRRRRPGDRPLAGDAAVGSAGDGASSSGGDSGGEVERPLQPRRLKGRTWLAEEAAGRSWRVSGGGFWQVHPGAAEVLAAAVLEGLEPRAGERALDLYAGVGLFAAVLATAVGPAGAVTAVETDRQAIADARRNLHDLPTVHLVAGRVDRVLGVSGPAEVSGPVDLVVLDPPRSGAGREVVQSIAARSPRRVAYVACDPAALARDLRTFASAGYDLHGLRAFDLFPMTQHVECVAVLEPRPDWGTPR